MSHYVATYSEPDPEQMGLKESGNEAGPYIRIAFLLTAKPSLSSN